MNYERWYLYQKTHDDKWRYLQFCAYLELGFGMENRGRVRQWLERKRHDFELKGAIAAVFCERTVPDDIISDLTVVGDERKVILE